jgi:hypothetical protein
MAANLAVHYGKLGGGFQPNAPYLSHPYLIVGSPQTGNRAFHLRNYELFTLQFECDFVAGP